MIAFGILIAAIGILSGLKNRSVLVGALPIIWFLWFVLCARLVGAK